MSKQLILVSHALCPYVQRAAIVLLEKGIPFSRRDIDLANKPEWFLAISPLGKTPVLLVDGVPIFESAVICEYLDDMFAPPLHPAEPLRRAQHRSWVEFGSSLLHAIGAFYSAPDDAALQAAASVLHHKLGQLEAVLGSDTFFDGQRLSIVDAVFAPAFRYFDVFERIDDFGFGSGLHKLTAWRNVLAAHPSVKAAVSGEYEHLLLAFLKNRNAALARRIADHMAMPFPPPAKQAPEP